MKKNVIYFAIIIIAIILFSIIENREFDFTRIVMILVESIIITITVRIFSKSLRELF